MVNLIPPLFLHGTLRSKSTIKITASKTRPKPKVNKEQRARDYVCRRRVKGLWSCITTLKPNFSDGRKKVSDVDDQPAIRDGHNSSPVLSNAEEDGLREIEMLQGRVTPSPSIVWEGAVGRAEVGGSDHDGSPQAVLVVVHAHQLIASSTAEAIVEEGCAQGSCVSPIPLAVQVAVATSTTCIPKVHRLEIQVVDIRLSFLSSPIVPDASLPP